MTSQNQHSRKKGPGRRHQQGLTLWPNQAVMRGVTTAPKWPGGKADMAKAQMRLLASPDMLRAAKELSRG